MSDMRSIIGCFEDPDNLDGVSINVSEIEFDNGENDYRVKIWKEDIQPNEDWSITFAQLQKSGYYVLGITQDRYDDYIYIWVKEKDIWEGVA